MINKILIALDGSDPANKALNFALDIAEKFSAEVLIVTVVHETFLPYIAIPGSIVPPTLANFSEELKESHEIVLKEALEESKKRNPDLKISTKLFKGHASDVIVESAKEEKVDLIVVGSRGLSGVKRFFLGSVSHNVAHHCECPVLIVK